MKKEIFCYRQEQTEWRADCFFDGYIIYCIEYLHYASATGVVTS